MYLKITLYKPMLFEADGINFRFAITAVKRMTKSAAPNCFPNFVLPMYIDNIIIRLNIPNT